MAEQKSLLDPFWVQVFPQLSPEQQRNGCDILKAKCTQIEGAGSTEAQLTIMGHSESGAPEDEREKLVNAGLDQLYWQLVRFLRVLAHFAVEHPGQTDVIPLLYLGVALHKVPGEEADALAAFTTAFDHGVDAESVNSTLWAQGCMSRLLRRMGRTQAAEEQEALIRDWLRWHKFGMPKSEFVQLVTDPDHEGEDFVMDHPEMQKLFEGVIDMGDGFQIHIG